MQAMCTESCHLCKIIKYTSWQILLLDIEYKEVPKHVWKLCILHTSDYLRVEEEEKEKVWIKYCSCSLFLLGNTKQTWKDKQLVNISSGKNGSLTIFFYLCLKYFILFILKGRQRNKAPP